MIDIYEQPAAAAGIIIAEVECDSLASLDRIVLPSWADREVTDDPNWSGNTFAAS